LYVRNVEGVLSENVFLDSNAVIAFGVNDKINALLKSENPDHKILYFAYFNQDDSITLLRADKDEKEYRIYHFED